MTRPKDTDKTWYCDHPMCMGHLDEFEPRPAVTGPNPIDTIREALYMGPVADDHPRREKFDAALAALTEVEHQLAADTDEMFALAQEKGLPFALDHMGYDGLGNLANELAARAVAAETALAEALERPGVEIEPDGTEIDWKGDATYAVEQMQAWRERAEAAERRANDLADALRRVKENAEAWHGLKGLDTGHARALAVIAGWCRAALDRQEQT